MSNLTKRQDQSGTYWVRRAYRPEDYEAPSAAITDLDRWRGDDLDVDALLAERDGPFVGYREVGRSVSGGKEWSTLLHLAPEYAIEVEVLDEGFGEARPVPPDRAYRLACDYDKNSTARIVYE